MRIKSEKDILDIGVRANIIAEIKGQENQVRKDEHFKRYQCFKDNTIHYVVKTLEQQLDFTTVQEMNFSLSNISFVKKIVEKLAKVYSNGCNRLIVNDDGEKNEEDTDKIQSLAQELDMDSIMQTTNRYTKNHKNCALYLKPCPYEDEDGNEYFTVKPQVLAPYLYDVVENYYDRTQPMVYILSNYDNKGSIRVSPDPAKEGRTINSTMAPALGDQKDQIISDEKVDENIDLKQYIWWSDSYHFTTNEMGEIIESDVSGEVNENPIGMIPLEEYAVDQDNSFWAQGGQDLSNEAININCMLSHICNIGVIQGYGQFYYKGSKVPRNLRVGPNHALIMEYQKDEDPVPEAGFLNANPQLDALRGLVEMKTSLLMTTNNLSTSSISLKSEGTIQFPSALAMLLDKAESLEDISDQRKLYERKEQCVWEKINKWLMYFKQQGTLDPDLEEYLLPEDFKVVVEFNPPSIMMTDSEKVDLVQKRSDLGLDKKVDLVKMLHTGMTDKEAEDYLATLDQEKADNMAKMQETMGMNADGTPADNNLNGGALNGGSKKDNSQPKPNNFGN